MNSVLSKSVRVLFTFSVAFCSRAASRAGAEQVTAVSMVPRLSIQGTVGATDQIQYCTNLHEANWLVLTNVLVPEATYSFVDTTAPSANGRFYRAVRLSPAGMTLIPAGSFNMGDGTDGSAFALPVHAVNVSGFFMDQYDVSKALWDSVKAWNGGNGYSYENAGAGKAPTHPVQMVNWRDCVKWCNARSEMEGRTPCYYNEAGLATVYKAGAGAPYVNWSANGYRLPTEAEWEKAARGGDDGLRFPWGNTISWANANYYSYPGTAGGYGYDVSSTQGYDPTFNDGVQPYTSPVGYLSANGYGLYDMSGNVWQWCWDVYGIYSAASQTDPTGPATGSTHVYRGGSWGSGAFMCRPAGRYDCTPESTFNNLGFRCVLRAAQ